MSSSSSSPAALPPVPPIRIDFSAEDRRWITERIDEVLANGQLTLGKYGDPAWTAPETYAPWRMMGHVRLDALMPYFPWTMLVFGYLMVCALRVPKVGHAGSRWLDRYVVGNLLIGYTFGILHLFPEYIVFGGVQYLLIAAYLGSNLVVGRAQQPYSQGLKVGLAVLDSCFIAASLWVAGQLSVELLLLCLGVLVLAIAGLSVGTIATVTIRPSALANNMAWLPSVASQSLVVARMVRPCSLARRRQSMYRYFSFATSRPDRCSTSPP